MSYGRDGLVPAHRVIYDDYVGNYDIGLVDQGDTDRMIYQHGVDAADCLLEAVCVDAINYLHDAARRIPDVTATARNAGVPGADFDQVAALVNAATGRQRLAAHLAARIHHHRINQRQEHA